MALIDTLESEDINIFIDCMTRLHCQHLKADIDHYIVSTSEKMVDKQDLQQKMVGKWSIKPSLAEKLVDILEFVVDKDEFTRRISSRNYRVLSGTSATFYRLSR